MPLDVFAVFPISIRLSIPRRCNACRAGQSYSGKLISTADQKIDIFLNTELIITWHLLDYKKRIHFAMDGRLLDNRLHFPLCNVLFTNVPRASYGLGFIQDSCERIHAGKGLFAGLSAYKRIVF